MSNIYFQNIFTVVDNRVVNANASLVKKMLNEGRGYELEESPKQGLSFSYLMNKHKKLALDSLIELGIKNENGKYNNLGLLLSDQCEHTIKIAIYQGIDKRIYRNSIEISGSILKQLDEAMDYLNKRNDMLASFGGLLRVDRLDYDITALREGILNAIMHRDYSYSGSIMINMYIDRIEIISLGGAYEDISKEAIILGGESLRNKKLANALKELLYTCSMGTGIDKIFSSYEGIDKRPELIPGNGVFKVVLPNRNYDGALVPDYVKAPIYLTK